MELEYNREKLEETLRHFHRVTGIAVSILDDKYRHIAGIPAGSNAFCALVQTSGEGMARCISCDRELLRACLEGGAPVFRTCHAGLTDMAFPIVEGGVTVGFALFGQVLETGEEKPSFADVRRRLSDLPADPGALREAYRELRCFDADAIRSAAEIVRMLVRCLFAEHVILRQEDETFRAVLAYIEEHLAEEITVPALCHRFGIGKNALYRLFHEKTHRGIKAYVRARRCARAERLLKTTDQSVAAVAEAAGIPDYRYFCRVFREHSGMTPHAYRQACRGRKITDFDDFCK